MRNLLPVYRDSVLRRIYLDETTPAGLLGFAKIAPWRLATGTTFRLKNQDRWPDEQAATASCPYQRAVRCQNAGTQQGIT